MSVNVPISIGELWDKFSILQIKLENIKDHTKISFVNNEINKLSKIINQYSYEDDILFNNLLSVNKSLWNIENNIRLKEKYKQFDSEFIDLARSVYNFNDKRSKIKNLINIKFNSNINEVKEYN